MATFDQGPLPSIASFKVAILSTTQNDAAMDQAKQLAAALTEKDLKPVIVAEILVEGVDATYTTCAAVLFDSVVAVDGTQEMFENGSSLYPVGRPAQILSDAFNYGKPVGAAGSGRTGFDANTISKAGNDEAEAGVDIVDDVAELTGQIEEGLKTFKFTSRFPLDSKCPARLFLVRRFCRFYSIGTLPSRDLVKLYDLLILVILDFERWRLLESHTGRPSPVEEINPIRSTVRT